MGVFFHVSMTLIRIESGLVRRASMHRRLARKRRRCRPTSRHARRAGVYVCVSTRGQRVSYRHFNFHFSTTDSSAGGPGISLLTWSNKARQRDGKHQRTLWCVPATQLLHKLFTLLFHGLVHGSFTFLTP